MQTSGCEHTLDPMETYHFEQAREQPLSFPPLSWSLNGAGEASAPLYQQPREVRKRGGKRGPGIKLSTDPQSVSARERRHRISDRFRILKSLVPGGRKMDTVSMLEEAIHYVQFLKTQIVLHQAAAMIQLPPDDAPSTLPFPSSSCMYMDVGCLPSSPHHQAISSVDMPPPQTFSCSLPPAPPSPLPPFPGCSFFDGDEMMIPQYGFKY